MEQARNATTTTTNNNNNNSDGEQRTNAAVVVGYQPPDVKCHIDSKRVIQRFLRHDPGIAGLDLYLSDDFSDGEDEDEFFEYSGEGDGDDRDEDSYSNDDDEMMDDDNDDDEAVAAAVAAGGGDVESTGDSIHNDEESSTNDDDIEFMDTDDNDDNSDEVDSGNDDDDEYAFKGKIGSAIGRSQLLRKLRIHDPKNIVAHGDVAPFFRRVANNRSIEHLSLDLLDFTRLDIFSILAPFLKHNHNLRCVEISGDNVSMTIPSLVPALLHYKTIRLERINFSFCDLGDGCAATLINALTAMHGVCYLLELDLSHNEIGLKGSTALGVLLNSDACKIQCLSLQKNHLDNKCIEVLANGMMNNNTIKVLDIGDLELITPIGWQTFSECYVSNPNCSIEKIGLRNNNIGDEGVISLGESMTVNNMLKLKSLDFSNVMSITSAGWRGFSTGLKSMVLEEFKLSGTDIDDGGVIAIVTALIEIAALTTLDMKTNQSITPAGWIQCFRLMIDSEFSLENLFVSHNNIDDEGVAILIKSLPTHTDLKVLDMKNNRSISAPGWIIFFRSLLRSSSSVEALFLDCNNVDDEGAALLIRLTKTRSIETLTLQKNELISFDGWRGFVVALKSTKLKILRLGAFTPRRARLNNYYVISFARALARTKNATLEILSLYDDDEFPEISSRVWNAFAKVLCDTSSISKIYSSNHTLRELTVDNGVDEYPPFTDFDVEALMSINQNTNKAEVVRTKILRYFSDGAKVNACFVDVAMSLIPSVIEWIGRDCFGLLAMYEFLRSMPWMVRGS